MYRVAKVPNQIQDDDTNLPQHHDFEPYRNKPLPSINWSEEEITDLDQVTKPIKKYSRLWVKHKVLELEADDTKFTYNLMGDLESQSEEEVEAEKGDDTSEPHDEEGHEEDRPV